MRALWQRLLCRVFGHQWSDLVFTQWRSRPHLMPPDTWVYCLRCMERISWPERHLSNFAVPCSCDETNEADCHQSPNAAPAAPARAR